MEKVSGKRKLITREQLVQMSSKSANPVVRRSPRNHVPVTPTTPNMLARKTLFPSQGPTNVPTVNHQVQPSTAEKDALQRWSMLLNSMARIKELRSMEDTTPAPNERQRYDSEQQSHVQPCKSPSLRHDVQIQNTDIVQGSGQHPLRRSARHAEGTNQHTNVDGRTEQRSLRRSPRHAAVIDEDNNVAERTEQPPLRRSPRHADLTNQNSEIGEGSGQPSLRQSPRHAYNRPNRRRIQAAAPRNSKGRGGNKTKALKDPVFVEVNEFGQPVGDSERPLSSLIGCLARDPRRLPLDIWDWRKVSRQKKDAVWDEVKLSYTFPEGREPYDWAMSTMNAAWRLEKCDLKIAHFDGRTHNEAIAQRSQIPYIPEDMWKNLVEFWESPQGQARSRRNIGNRSKLTMPHYAGSKSFARVRAEKQKKDGQEPDPLAVWLDTHQPKKGSRLDKASEATKKSIESDLAALPSGSGTAKERMRIFKKHVGDNKNGYAKTYGLGVKVPRSCGKRCALEEEQAKRIKSEEKVEKLEKQLHKVTSIVKRILQLEGYSLDEIRSDESNDEEDAADDNTENAMEAQGEDNAEDDGSPRSESEYRHFEDDNVM